MANEEIINACYQIAVSIMDSSIVTATNFESQMKYHISNSINVIKRYCSIDSISSEYYNAITNLAIVYFNNQKVILNNSRDDKCSQMTQGSRSITFKDMTVQINSTSGIPDFIKAMLPTPKIRMFG